MPELIHQYCKICLAPILSVIQQNVIKLEADIVMKKNNDILIYREKSILLNETKHLLPEENVNAKKNSSVHKVCNLAQRIQLSKSKLYTIKEKPGTSFILKMVF